MQTLILRRFAAVLAILAGLTFWLPEPARACACGCGVFGVGTNSLFPTGSGPLAYFETDFMDQNQNRSGVSSAPAENNDDKEIKTAFYTLGVQYMVGHAWGFSVEVPYWDRTFKTEGDSGVDTFKHAAFGDVRLTGMYTGFSPDLSSGLTFGVKLPTGDFKYANFDRDTEIGTGSTDLLLGGFHRGALTKDNSFSYFVQALWDKPIASQGGYTPGDELDVALGGYYGGFNPAGGKLHVSPIVKLIASQRSKDSGENADPPNTGYSRLILAPGVEVAAGDWKLYGDVEFPLYEHYNGNQLAAKQLYKIVLSRNF